MNRRKRLARRSLPSSGICASAKRKPKASSGGHHEKPIFAIPKHDARWVLKEQPLSVSSKSFWALALLPIHAHYIIATLYIVRTESVDASFARLGGLMKYSTRLSDAMHILVLVDLSLIHISGTRSPLGEPSENAKPVYRSHF